MGRDEDNHYIFDIRWSQTDKSTIIVQETSKEKALALLKKKFNGARYIDFVRGPLGKILKDS